MDEDVTDHEISQWIPDDIELQYVSKRPNKTITLRFSEKIFFPGTDSIFISL